MSTNRIPVNLYVVYYSTVNSFGKSFESLPITNMVYKRVVRWLPSSLSLSFTTTSSAC